MSSLAEAPVHALTSVWMWRGQRMHYARRGSGEPVLLIHSLNAAASAYEMRKVFLGLEDTFDVIAPDLPGFGASERRRMDYTANLYTDFILDFCRARIGIPCHVIASSLGAAYVIRAASLAPELFRKLVLIAPTGIRALADERPTRLRQTARHILFSPVGTLFFKALSTRPVIRYFMTNQGFYDPRCFTREHAEHLYRTMRVKNAKYAPIAFLTGIANCNISHAFGRLLQPVLLVWGKNARTTPARQAEDFLARKPEAQLVLFENCALLPHDEHADRFNQLARQFLAS
ncbi:alpha/beta fold hydrolase [Chloracidobacterium thermophilum]|uniref:Putative hydrolases or acyltransferases (Alpha/beta hydrolase superfamily) n=1 Tax=Chloracidobacterium thermophilum (strain B) TaxID=981222 RepID=G2LFV7_CHLTF|nr:alpha/beta fold hydrolase [Chloracidobacterium thermophilum]AEP11751.1 putative hydrolases or acyltransferases (alpha/beta hydrolase superfamily) [Chloracidobacterium thermophilum B]QUV79623.1 alpha/beta fold hydrolase [Chloracidobacterium thermophilum]